MTRPPSPDDVVDRYEDLEAERRTRAAARTVAVVLLAFAIVGGLVALLTGGWL